jgi:4'-phosphopantetheinyl transferase
VAEEEVGIDIQQMIPLPVSRQNLLSHKILTKDEKIKYAALPDCEQPDFLYRRFSMKESCVKAVGLGMRRPFSTITLKEEKNYFTWEYRSTQFFIREYFFDPEYKLSLCSIQRSVAEIQSF